MESTLKALPKPPEAKDIEGCEKRPREKKDPGKEVENKDEVEEVPWKLQQIFTYIGSRYSQETFRPSDTPTAYYCSFCDFSATLLPVWDFHHLSVEHRTNIQSKSSTLDCNVCGIRLIFNATTQAFFLNCQEHQQADFKLKLIPKIENSSLVPSNQSLTSEGPSSELLSLSISREGSEKNSYNKSSTDEAHNSVNVNTEPSLKLEPSSNFPESVPEVLDKKIPPNLPVISRLEGRCFEEIALKLKEIQSNQIVSCLTCNRSKPAPTFAVQHLTNKNHIKKVADCLELYYTFCSFCDLLAISHLECLVRFHIDMCASKISNEEKLACVSFLEPVGGRQFIKLKAKTVEGLVPLILHNFYTESFPVHVTDQGLTCLPCLVILKKGETLEQHFLGKEHIKQVAHCSELYYTFCCKCDRITASHSECMVREHIAHCDHIAPHKLEGRSFQDLTEILLETLQTIFSDLHVAKRVVKCLSCRDTIAAGKAKLKQHFLGFLHAEHVVNGFSNYTRPNFILPVADIFELYYIVCPRCRIFVVSHSDSMVEEHNIKCPKKSSVTPKYKAQPAAHNLVAPNAAGQLLLYKLKDQNIERLNTRLLETINLATSHLPPVQKVVTCLPCLVTVTGDTDCEQHIFGKLHSEQVANLSELYYIVCPRCKVFIVSHLDSMVRKHVDQCKKKIR